MDKSGSMAQGNAALAEVCSALYIWREPDSDNITIEPSIHPSVAAALVEQGKVQGPEGWTPWLLPEGSDPPPMRWLEAASRNAEHTWEPWH